MHTSAITLSPLAMITCGLAVAVGATAGVSAQTAGTTELPGIVVTATRSPEPVVNLMTDIDTLDSDESRRALSMTQLLRFAGGLQVTTNGGPAATSGVLIRGGNAGHTLTLIEGFRVSSASLGQTTFEGLPLVPISRIEVLRGPASALYGADALAGVVQLFAPSASPGGLQLSGQAAAGQENTQQVSGGLSGGTEALSGGLILSRDRSDGFNATTPDNFGFNPDRDGYRRDGALAHFDARLSGGSHLRGIAMQNRLVSDFDDGAFNNARVDQRTELIGLKGSHELDSATELGFKLGQSSDESAVFSSFPGRFRSRLLQYGVSGTRRLNSDTQLQLLVERLEEKVVSTSYDDSAAGKRTTNSIGLVALTSEGPHLLQAGVRLDDSSQYAAQTNYSIAYGYRLGGGLRAGGSFATGFHAPGFNDLYFPNYGRNVIRPETSRSAELGLYWRQQLAAASPASSVSRAGRRAAAPVGGGAEGGQGGWHGKAVLFQSRVRDLISFASVCPDPDPQYAFGCADNVDRARISGLSLGIGQSVMSPAERRSTGLDWYLNLDFLDPRNEISDTRLARRATRQVTAGAAYGVGDVMVGADLLAANRRFDDAANRQALGGYLVLNLRAAYQLGAGWQAFATVDNAGDRRYATAFGYAPQGRLVMLGVRYRSD